MLVFGLGDSSKIDEIDVVWPSGKRQSWIDVALDSEISLVEGRNQVFYARER